MQDVRRFHQAFYAECDKIKQDNIILKYSSGATPQRRRSTKKGSSSKSIAVKYYVKRTRQQSGSSIVQVCQKTFLYILDISKDRVQRVNKRHMHSGSSPSERRGGDRISKKYSDKCDAVKNYIRKFKPCESHYCRGKSVRKYLPSDLSIRKMWLAYNKEHNLSLQVKYHYFRDIFVRNFNLSFKTPATDACSTCISYLEKIKLATDNKKKEDLKAEYHVHKLKAEAFYSLLKQENDENFILSFDCQKNMVLPRVPDQAAYYSRQFYSYNFTICQGNSKSPQNETTVFIYNWLETEFRKSSNEIVSAVYHRLNCYDLSNYSFVKLFADGAASQNKNSSMLVMLGYWLANEAPNNIQRVDIIFPIVGHSFLPADRVFGRIEQVVKKKDTIIHPEEYRDIFSKAGTVFQLGQDNVKVFDWKSAATATVKKPGSWHFQFQPSKRLSLKKSKTGSILVRGEANYRSDLGAFKGICKKGQNFSFTKPPEIKIGSCPLNQKKADDVNKLLTKHFGDLWKDDPSLQFYKDVLEAQQNVVDDNADDILGEDEEYLFENDAISELRV